MLSLPLQYSVGVIQVGLILCLNNFVKLMSRITAEQRHRMFFPMRQVIQLRNQ